MNINNIIDWIAVLLVLVGSINWVLFGFLNLNIVNTVSFGIGILEQIIYALIALSSLYLVYVKITTK